MKVQKAIIAAAALLFAFSVQLRAQDQRITLSGRVFNEETKKPVEYGSVVVVELKIRAPIGQDGRYAIAVPKPGIYTIRVSSAGLGDRTAKIALQADTVRDFTLSSPIIRGGGITIVGKRDLQTVSRHTMSKEQIKDVPATFGDSMNAIASLPGVIRAGGDLFGPIVIRGGDYRGVRYLVDDIPIYNPLHYGGLHSVINTNIINEIDLLSSAFPAEIGSATSAVISIRTTDSVKEFGGYSDISLLSATALLQTCVIQLDGGGIGIGTPFDEYRKEQKNRGYIIASGRMGYLDLIVLPLVQLMTGERIGIVPKYWDYQFKAKYQFTDSHSLTLFAMGSKDYFKLVDEDAINQGNDPLLTGLRVKTDQQTHGQGLYYTYQPSDQFRNRITLYSSLRQNYLSAELPMPGVNAVLQNLYIDSRPYVFGAIDKWRVVAVKKRIEVRGGFEYTLYHFRARGNSADTISRGFTIDVSEDRFVPIIHNQRTFNHTIGGYLETKVTWEGLTFMPGFRTDYLKRSGEATWDPRVLLSYEFPTDTKISVAGGKYSYFFQTNPLFFDAFPQYATIGKGSHSEWAIHRVCGVEQGIGLFSVKVEGFWNEFFNLAQRYLHFSRDWRLKQVMNSGKIRAYGVEVMLKKDRQEGKNDFFGWVSYTYTRSKSRSGLPPYPYLYGNPYNDVGDPWGDRWINYSQEQNHSLKMIAGYAFWKHTITGKFQLYTSTPYTPIVWGQQDTKSGYLRYYPVYGRPNSRRFPMNHRLDIRYTYTTNYSWGYLSWYIEVINVYNNRPVIMESWNYQLPYLGKYNPKKMKLQGLAFIPNFGVEVHF